MSRVLERERTALVVIDMQEAFGKAIDGFDEGARVLGVPIVVTEQYPRGLGETVPEVAQAVGDAPRIEKVVFSAARAEGFDLNGCDQALVCGVETHVCVNQTVEDLLDQGKQVHVAADAVGSRTAANRELALHKMEGSGAVISSVETALLELVGAAGSDEFKAIQRLIL